MNLEGVGTGGAPAADHLPGEVQRKWPNALSCVELFFVNEILCILSI